MGIDRILSRLDGVSGKAPRWQARCPAHPDKSPSLSLKITPDNWILIHCHTGCAAADVLAAIGLSLADLFPDSDGRKYMPHTNPPMNWYDEAKDGRAFRHLQEENARLKAEIKNAKP